MSLALSTTWLAGTALAAGFDTSTIEVEEALAARVPADMRETGVLVGGSDNNYAPWEYMAVADGQTPEGIDVDIGKALAAKLGLDYESRTAQFTTILPALAVRRWLRDLPASTRSQSESFCAKASSLLGRTGTLNLGFTVSVRRYLRMVLRDNPVRRSISRIGTLSQKCQRRITLNNAMSITPVLPGQQLADDQNMGQISVKIYALRGSVLSGGQHGMRLIGAGNYPRYGAPSGSNGARKANDVGQYASAIAAFLDEKRDHINYDQSRSVWLDSFVRMPPPTSLLLPFIFTLFNHPIVDFGAWTRGSRCHGAGLIGTHLSES